MHTYAWHALGRLLYCSSIPRCNIRFWELLWSKQMRDSMEWRRPCHNQEIRKCRRSSPAVDTYRTRTGSICGKHDPNSEDKRKDGNNVDEGDGEIPNTTPHSRNLIRYCGSQYCTHWLCAGWKIPCYLKGEKYCFFYIAYDIFAR